MKRVLNNLWLLSILAVLVLCAFEPDGVRRNIAHFMAWILVAMQIIVVIAIYFLVENIDAGKKLSEKDQAYAERARKRGRFAKAYSAILVFAFALAMAASGWFVAATLFALSGLLVQGGKLYIQDQLNKKAARDADV